MLYCFLNKQTNKKDVVKLIHKNKDEQSPILDLSKNNVTIIPTSLKEVSF